MRKVYVGATKTWIRLDCKQVLTGATTLEIHFKKPDDSVEGSPWTADPDPVYNERLYYEVLADDLDVAGTWTFQAYVVKDGWADYGVECYLKVHTPEVA